MPDAVGVPESTPVGDSESPAGRVPDATAHVYDLPPVAESVVEYGVNVAPLGSDVVVICNGA